MEVLKKSNTNKNPTINFYSENEEENSSILIEQRIGNESPSFNRNTQFSHAELELPNEISAPYEVPQFPIEQIEKKLAIQRQINVKVLEEGKRSHYEPSISADDRDQISIEDHELFVPHFQRVSISGEDTSGVPLEDLERASKMLVEALRLRKRYMNMSHQNFCQTAARFLDPGRTERKHGDKQTIEGKARRLKQAKEEAQDEIEKYRKERERQFREFEAKHMGSREDVASKIDQDTKQRVDDMNRTVVTQKEPVILDVLDLVYAIKPELHKNYRQ